MKKRIYWNMFVLTVVSIILTALLLIGTFYNAFNRQMEEQVKTETAFLQKSLNFSLDDLAYIESLRLGSLDDRITIIRQDGNVLLDSYAIAENTENHLDHPEIQQAFDKGFGQNTRYSATLGEKTYYYAVRLDDNTVLRLAKTTDNAYIIMANVLPMVFIVILFSFILCNILAVRLTKRIVEPINSIDLLKKPGDIYEELAPFIRMINTQREQINEQFVDLEDRATTIRTITENMKEGILILDQKGVILSANRSALDFFHGGLHNYWGRNILELTRNIDLTNSIKKSLSGSRCNLTLELNAKTVQIFLNPVFINNKINGVIVLFLDITQKATTEKMRREFSANVSHELKTPLTTILGYAEILNNGMVKPEHVQNCSKKIKDESTRLITLIEDIIKLSQLDESSGTGQAESFCIKAVALDTIERLRLPASDKNITLMVVGNEKIITANKNMISEMLFNLIDNGIKYNKQDGSVTITLLEADEKIIIEVTDTGIGIDKKDLNRIFERFYRVDKSRSKKTGGTGLGLSIVKHIVEYHNGTIDIESEKGKGTTITITL